MEFINSQTYKKIVPFSPSDFNMPHISKGNAWSSFSLAFGWTSTSQLHSFLPGYLNSSADSIQIAKILKNPWKESPPLPHPSSGANSCLLYFPVQLLQRTASICSLHGSVSLPLSNVVTKFTAGLVGNPDTSANNARSMWWVKHELLYNFLKLYQANPCCTELHFLFVCFCAPRLCGIWKLTCYHSYQSLLGGQYSLAAEEKVLVWQLLNESSVLEILIYSIGATVTNTIL